jgi:hypothetical protein
MIDRALNRNCGTRGDSEGLRVIDIICENGDSVAGGVGYVGAANVLGWESLHLIL